MSPWKFSPAPSYASARLATPTLKPPTRPTSSDWASDFVRVGVASNQTRRSQRRLWSSSLAAAPRRCGGHVAVHGRDKYLILLACGGVALGSQSEAHAASDC